MLDARTWEPRGRPLRANAAVLTVDLSADGGLLATTSTDRTGRLWDVATGRPVGAALSGSGRDPIAAAFVDGERLAVLHDRGGVAWDLTPEAWAAHACAVAGRPLTRAEWESALPRHDYAPVCGRP
jgi:hypothetical protein